MILLNAFIGGVEKINDQVNSFVWGPVMLVFFLLIGLYFSVRTKFFQITKIGLWLKTTFLSIFTKKEVRKTKDKKSISQFQALSTALAGTMGTGNIAGVATALVSGGPGAIFWMWISAFLGMMTNFAEKTLGIKYRYKNEKGEWVGGAMVYIDRGLKQKWLAIIFSIFCILASFGIGNMSQANSIADSVKNTIVSIFPSINPDKPIVGGLTIGHIITISIGILMAILVGSVIIGGIKRIASFTEKVVPFMSITYMIGGLAVILINYDAIPEAFASIFREAFNFKAAFGGALGYGISMAMKYGISRGVFSNEAGLGSSVMAHSASDTKEPVVQGMWGIFEVFADTIVVCTVTAIAILTTGVYNMDIALADALNNTSMHTTGAALTSNAFTSVFGNIGSIFVSLSIILFAFSTLIGWSYYGERGLEYIAGSSKYNNAYKIIFCCVIIIGCVSKIGLVWEISDTFNGLMAIPNLIALVILSPQVIQLTKDYLKRRKQGRLFT